MFCLSLCFFQDSEDGVGELFNARKREYRIINARERHIYRRGERQAVIFFIFPSLIQPQLLKC